MKAVLFIFWRETVSVSDLFNSTTMMRCSYLILANFQL